VTDPRALLDAYAEEVVDVESDFGVFEPIKRADAAGAMLAALRAVLDLHQPSPFNENPRYVWCITCQTSSRAIWPCETYQAITAALTCGDTL
jgi:hypothetical protein